ncbi:hypothetical protein ASD62_03000 [Phycicoccus sp. Root563]|uniref:hypothetical protein n=1 Tax=Phycicoccus sp. Root563 TaxID=1736562 RepID=UPI0007030096|nr:hypothetical protein [Phycicoccus sp. Root563]KQZ88435.1 hypothetical protein ASD62_03000 [Phycicoccus sp. Root563]
MTTRPRDPRPAAPTGYATHGGRHDHAAAARAYRRAWWSLTLYPLTFLLAFGLGEGILALLTDDPEHAAFWQGALAAVPALVVFVTPGILAITHGRTAVRLGRRAGRIPAIVGGVIGGGFIATNLAAFINGLITSG